MLTCVCEKRRGNAQRAGQTNAPEGLSLKKTDGVLGDVAPTILDIMGLPKPEEMGGTSLLVKS